MSTRIAPPRHDLNYSVLRSKLEALGVDAVASLLAREAGQDDRIANCLSRLFDCGCANGVASDEVVALKLGCSAMVGNSVAIKNVAQTLSRFSTTDSPVLITGESGTGKELAALAIHERTPRYCKGPFVPINCAGLPPGLIASELFGHEKGAFTGAHQRYAGRIESAQGGTVFLDEIGDLPLELQVHLLRFIEDRTVDRVGGKRPIPVDVRIIAATNSDLRKAMAQGRFRPDLYYRLSVLTLDLPPLRDRGGDVELLADHFLRVIGTEMRRPGLTFDEAAREAINQHRWPGNVRQLISCIRRAVVMAGGDRITLADLALVDSPAAALASAPVIRVEDMFRDPLRPNEDKAPSLDQAKEMLEGALIQKALTLHKRNMTRAAEYLGISRVHLYRLVEKHGLRQAEGSVH